MYYCVLKLLVKCCWKCDKNFEVFILFTIFFPYLGIYHKMRLIMQKEWMDREVVISKLGMPKSFCAQNIYRRMYVSCKCKRCNILLSKASSSFNGLKEVCILIDCGNISKRFVAIIIFWLQRKPIKDFTLVFQIKSDLQEKGSK